MSVLINGKQAQKHGRVRFLLKLKVRCSTTSLRPGLWTSMAGNFRGCVKGSMPPATAQNRPFYINLDPNAAGRLFEYRPVRVNGVLQWVLRPVYRWAYWIQRLIRRIRDATAWNHTGHSVFNIDGQPLPPYSTLYHARARQFVPYSVNLT